MEHIPVHEGGSVYVVHAGAWHKLLLDASGGTITNYTDPLKCSVRWKHKS